jgi:hypothetical protein
MAWLPLALLLAACASAPPPAPPVEIGSFGNFTPPAGYAHYLACPRDYCLAKPDEIAALKQIPADRFRHIVKTALDALPRNQLLHVGTEGLRLVYRQQPGWLGGSDIVTVEILDVDEGISSVVIYSQSETLSADAGANRAQVKAWLAAIDEAIAHELLPAK